MSKTIILFRFHKDFEICKERVRLLKHFNPDLDIHGLYGGPSKSFQKAKATLSGGLLSLMLDSHTNPKWKWLHADLSLKEWFRTFGHNLDFNYLHDYESDILTLAPLSEIYPPIDSQTIALSGLQKLAAVKAKWDWTSKEPYKAKYLNFLDHMKRKYTLDKITFASLGPGPYLSRKFLEDYCQQKDVDTVVSEISYPAFAQALGYKIVDTGLHPQWDSKEADKFFNCMDVPIAIEAIEEEAKKANGRRAFHPVKYTVTLERILSYSRGSEN